MDAKGCVMCLACNQWRSEPGVDGICQSCEIEDEIEPAIGENGMVSCLGCRFPVTQLGSCATKRKCAPQ